MGKLIRVRMLGAGTQTDPFRAALPIFSRLIRDDETPFGIQAPRACIVEIPDNLWLEPEGAETQPLTINVVGIGVVIRQLNPQHRARMLANIKALWRERKDTYDVQDS